MPDPTARLFFDFVDPLSYVTELALSEIESALGAIIDRVGYELRPPPTPLSESSDPSWAARLESARRVVPGVRLDPPVLVPWSRKAHEVHLFAESRGAGSAVRRGIFEAYFAHGRDIGRVDELVAIAAAAGLDQTEAKAALDVDRYEEDVRAARRAAEGLGVVDLPSILVGGRLVEGFHNPTDLRTLLGGSP